MGEFNLNKRKRNWDRNLSRYATNISLANNANQNENKSLNDYESMWSSRHDDPPSTSSNETVANLNTDVKDVNFWTNVFFNNNNNNIESRMANGASSTPTSPLYTSANNNQSERKAKKNHPTNTAILLNNIISNLKDHQTKIGVVASGTANHSNNATSNNYDMDTISNGSHEAKNHFSFSVGEDSLPTSKPSYTFLSSVRPKSLKSNRKNLVNSSTQKKECDTQDRDNIILANDELRRLSLEARNDCSSINCVGTLNALNYEQDIESSADSKRTERYSFYIFFSGHFNSIIELKV